MKIPERARRVEYPGFWPYEAYSPSVETVHEAYMNGELSEMRLEKDLEHALEHPEPPTRDVWLGPEDAVLLIHDDFPSTVAELDGVEVEIDREVEFVSHQSTRRHHIPTSIEVGCPADTVEDVFAALNDGLDDEEVRPDDGKVRAYTESVTEL